jgi:hypothetical protein
MQAGLVRRLTGIAAASVRAVKTAELDEPAPPRACIDRRGNDSMPASVVPRWSCDEAARAIGRTGISSRR